MTEHPTATQEQWLGQRLELLKAEKALRDSRERRGGEAASSLAVGED